MSVAQTSLGMKAYSIKLDPAHQAVFHVQKSVTTTDSREDWVRITFIKTADLSDPVSLKQFMCC